MKIFLTILWSTFVFVCSCKTNDKTAIISKENSLDKIQNSSDNLNLKQQQDTIDYYLPKFANAIPSYHPYDKKEMKNDELIKYKSIQSKLKDLNGNFLGDSDENDIIGHPDYDSKNLKIWINDVKRKKITFYAKKISKGYGFYYDKNELILVTEAIKTNRGFEMDSIFLDKNILIWKNSKNEVVLDENIIQGKRQYLNRLSREIDEIYRNELGFIEQYEYEKDSLSSFVILNLKD